MGKIRQLRLRRPEERQSGLGREELAVLLGERKPDKKGDRPAMPRGNGRERGKTTR